MVTGDYRFHAFLLGEKYFGEAKDVQSTAAIIIGTGVGFGMWDGKRFIADSLGLPKIGIYKIPYQDGVLEDFVSGRGVSASYERKTGKVISAKDIEDLARKGDVVSRLVYEDMGAVLGSIVGGILSEYGMQAVVFGGRLSLAFDFFGQSFSRAICAEEKHIKVYQSHMQYPIVLNKEDWSVAHKTYQWIYAYQDGTIAGAKNFLKAVHDLEIMYRRKENPWIEARFDDGSSEKLWTTFSEHQLDINQRSEEAKKFHKENLEFLSAHAFF